MRFKSQESDKINNCELNTTHGMATKKKGHGMDVCDD